MLLDIHIGAFGLTNIVGHPIRLSLIRVCQLRLQDACYDKASGFIIQALMARF